ncbi:MAG: (d)CMP kinase, partial [Oscillospiraceae bacterium]|nr:(d)CMP kinase [Oscillospiraceae bacterium]
GKSTVAKALAASMGFIYVDTGALYRAIGYYAYDKVDSTTNAEAVSALLGDIDIQIKYIDGVQRIFLNGADVSEDIRSPEMSMAASNVSAIPAVRAFLLDLQRRLAAENNVVMDGRDIGTVILPNAQVKIFLTASPEERARRRMLEYKQKGQEVDFDQLLAEIKQRDYNDSHRATAPLKQADDAVLVDSTEMKFEQVLDKITAIVKEKF